MVIFIFTFGEHLSLNTLALPVFFFPPFFPFFFFFYIIKDVLSFIIPPPFFSIQFRVPTPLFIYFFFFFLLFFLIGTCVCSFEVQRRFSYLTLPHLKKKKSINCFPI